MEIKELKGRSAQHGRVDWIGTRPAKRQPLASVATVRITSENGIEGDHYSGSQKTRQVTLIQAEHLVAVAGILGRETPVSPLETRRNIVVSGINLLSLRDSKFRIGDTVILEGTGHCPPCTRMEENLGFGGYNAMRGHGGITARVIDGGTISTGDEVILLASTTEPR